MRIAAAVLLSGILALASQHAGELSHVKKVYLLPMSGNLDQYLANRLTSSHVFQVVTDPKKADAVFTDRVGESFQKRMEELYPEPPAPQPAKDEKSENAEDGKEAPPPVDTGKIIDDTTRSSAFGRGKGNVFLVDGRNRAVIWSFYGTAKRSRAEEQNRLAGQIVDQLKHDIKAK